MRSMIHGALNANQSRVEKSSDRVRRNHRDTAIGDFEKLLECVNECETEEIRFFLGRLRQRLMAIHNLKSNS
jgi:hypothetical protein